MAIRTICYSVIFSALFQFVYGSGMASHQVEKELPHQSGIARGIMRVLLESASDADLQGLRGQKTPQLKKDLGQATGNAFLTKLHDRMGQMFHELFGLDLEHKRFPNEQQREKQRVSQPVTDELAGRLAQLNKGGWADLGAPVLPATSSSSAYDLSSEPAVTLETPNDKHALGLAEACMLLSSWEEGGTDLRGDSSRWRHMAATRFSAIVGDIQLTCPVDTIMHLAFYRQQQRIAADGGLLDNVARLRRDLAMNR